jgi:hypothetical protein
MVDVAVPPAESASYLVDVAEHEAAQLVADARVGGSDAAKGIRHPPMLSAGRRWMRLK